MPARLYCAACALLRLPLVSPAEDGSQECTWWFQGILSHVGGLLGVLFRQLMVPILMRHSEANFNSVLSMDSRQTTGDLLRKLPRPKQALQSRDRQRRKDVRSDP